MTDSKCTSSTPPPAPSTCNYNTYPNTTEGNVKLMYDILVGSGADGFDFDFETPDQGGRLSVAFIPFAAALKAYGQAATPQKQIVLTMTLMSGADIKYAALYDCFRSSTCPFDYAVPMPYANCMYPYTGTQLYSETWDNVSVTWSHSVPYNPTQTFYWNSLMDVWTQNYFTDESVTQLVIAVETIQHDQWYPCAISNSDLGHVYSDYTHAVLPGACTHVVGTFFFWYEELTPPSPLTALNSNRDMYNSSFVTELILEWQRLITQTS